MERGTGQVMFVLLLFSSDCKEMVRNNKGNVHCWQIKSPSTSSCPHSPSALIGCGHHEKIFLFIHDVLFQQDCQGHFQKVKKMNDGLGYFANSVSSNPDQLASQNFS
jgi:hypothetical protein